jgi:photosystem II stability/assembly factor-like uncharacterized protein
MPTWILVKHGILTDAPAAAGGARRLYVLGSAIYKSTDDGATWTTIYTPTDTLYGANFFEVAGGQDVVVAYEQTGGGADVVKASTDGGATFNTVTAPRAGTPSPFFFVLAISATNWLLTNDAEAYQTTNGGSSWSDVSGTYAGQVFSQASSAGGKIWSNQGADPGGTGTKLNIDGTGLATFARGPFSGTGGAANIAISDTLALVASGGGLFYPRLYLVTGTTPALITPDAGPDFWPGADSLDGTLICALGCTSGPTGEIWRSTNGGAAWARVAGPDADLYCQFGYDQVLGVATGDPTFWAVIAGSFGVAGNCWTSTDSGATWSQQGTMPGSDGFLSALRVFGS